MLASDARGRSLAPQTSLLSDLVSSVTSPSILLLEELIDCIPARADLLEEEQPARRRHIRDEVLPVVDRAPVVRKRALVAGDTPPVLGGGGGKQAHSGALMGNQGHSGAISGTQWHPVARRRESGQAGVHRGKRGYIV